MKKLVFFVLILIPFLGFNQITNHFEHAGSKWYIASNFINASLENPTHLGVITKVWGFLGDSMIDNQLWLKLYATPDSTFQNDLEFKGFIRSEGLKVFYKETETSTARELYDFGLEVGDTFDFELEFYGEIFNAQLSVTQIDIIEINGHPHKRFLFSNELPENYPVTLGSVLKEEWIEGVGSLRSPIFPAKAFTIDTEWGEQIDLTCSFVNEMHYFHHEYYEDCYNHDVLGIEEIRQNQFEIYPNPVKNEMQIVSTHSGVYDIEITNALGESISKSQLIGANTSINVEELAKGIYFLRIGYRNSWQTIKFIKQ